MVGERSGRMVAEMDARLGGRRLAGGFGGSMVGNECPGSVGWEGLSKSGNGCDGYRKWRERKK